MIDLIEFLFEIVLVCALLFVLGFMVWGVFALVNGWSLP